MAEYEGEASGMDLGLVTYIVVDEKSQVQVQDEIEVDANLPVSDITDRIIKNRGRSISKDLQDQKYWVLFFNDGTGKTHVRFKLAKTKTLKSVRNYGHIFSDKSYLELMRGCPEDEENQPHGKRKADNERVCNVVVSPPNSTSSIMFTKNVNITLPASSIIDEILNHQKVPDSVKKSLDQWQLSIVLEDQTYVLANNVTLNSLQCKFKDVFSCDVTLKVDVLQERNPNQQNGQPTMGLQFKNPNV